MEHYHQIFSNAFKQKLGRFLFGVADISPVEYIKEEELYSTMPVIFGYGSEGDYRD